MSSGAWAGPRRPVAWRGREAAVRLHHTPVDSLGRENILAAQCLGQIGRRDAKLANSLLYLAVADDCYRFAQEELGYFGQNPDKVLSLEFPARY